jgi:hypothetical protein
MQIHENFYAVFGREKERRIGETIAIQKFLELNPTAEELTNGQYHRVAVHRSTQVVTSVCGSTLFVMLIGVVSQRAHMDELLYDPDYLRSHAGPGGRVIVFAFCRAAGIFMSRLLEASGDKDLSGIVVVALPFGDCISRAGGEGEIQDHFTNHGEWVPCVGILFPASFPSFSLMFCHVGDERLFKPAPPRTDLCFLCVTGFSHAEQVPKAFLQLVRSREA